MKATTLLLAHHRTIQELVSAAIADAEAREKRTSDLVEAIVAHIATEETVLYPTVERELAVDLRALRASHVKTRLALFRVVTAATHSVEFASYLATLDMAMREHALGESQLVRTLEDQMSDTGLHRLGEKMQEFESSLVARPAFCRARKEVAALAS